MIRFIAETNNIPEFNEKEIVGWMTSTAAEYGKKTGKINYIFCSDERILEVNNQYLQHDYYTDIITFDYTNGSIISGDIFVSLDTVKSNSVLMEIPFLKEFYRVLIHGILHLCGQGDKTPEDELVMRQKEDNALLNLSNF